MSDAFYTMLGIVLPILIVQLVQLRQSSIAARKADDASRAVLQANAAAESSRAAIKMQLDAVATVAFRTKDEMADAKKAGIREGHEQGLAIGIAQASNFMNIDSGRVDLKL